MHRSRYGTWEVLRRLRTEHGWNAADLARNARLLPSYLSMLENGHRWPNARVLKKLAVALDVPVTMLERSPAEKERGAA